MNMFQNRCPILYNSSAFLLSFFCIVQSHSLYSVISWISPSPPPILAPFSLFYDPIVSYLRKEKWQWKQGYLFCFVLNHIILIKKYFLTSAYFFPFNMKSLLYQKLSSLKAKFCFCFLFYFIVCFLTMQQKYEINYFGIKMRRKYKKKITVSSPTFTTHFLLLKFD